MIESDDGGPPPRPSYIVSGSEDSADQNELPGIGKYLFQALVVAVFIGFLLPLILVLLYPGLQYHPLLLVVVVSGLTYGLAFAVVEAIVIWACSYMAGHRLHPLVRAGIGAAVPYVVIDLWVIYEQRNNAFISPGDYLHWLVAYCVVGAVCGLVIGSGRLGARS